MCKFRSNKNHNNMLHESVTSKDWIFHLEFVALYILPFNVHALYPARG